MGALLGGLTTVPMAASDLPEARGVDNHVTANFPDPEARNFPCQLLERLLGHRGISSADQHEVTFESPLPWYRRCHQPSGKAMIGSPELQRPGSGDELGDGGWDKLTVRIQGSDHLPLLQVYDQGRYRGASGLQRRQVRQPLRDGRCRRHRQQNGSGYSRDSQLLKTHVVAAAARRYLSKHG